MAQQYGLKALHPSAAKHILGQVTPLTGAAVLLELWNDSTGTDIILQVDEAGQVRLEDGTVLLPALVARADLATGLYFPTVGEIAAAVSGSQAFHIDATNVISKLAHLIANGTVSLPGIAFESDPDTGFYRIGANSVGFAAAGALVAQITAQVFTIPTGAQGGSALYDAVSDFAIDWNNGNKQKFLLGATNTVTELNGVAGFEYTMWMKQDGSGSRTITWPATFKGEDGGVVPQPDVTAGRTTIYAAVYDGTNYAVKDAGSWDL